MSRYKLLYVLVPPNGHSTHTQKPLTTNAKPRWLRSQCPTTWRTGCSRTSRSHLAHAADRTRGRVNEMIFFKATGERRSGRNTRSVSARVPGHMPTENPTTVDSHLTPHSTSRWRRSTAATRRCPAWRRARCACSRPPAGWARRTYAFARGGRA